MRIRKLSFDTQIDERVSAGRYFSGGENELRGRMKKLMGIAIKNELTERQRECIRMYYYENKKVCEIAEYTGIRPTTVYKHLKLGRNALKKCTAYL